MLEDLKNAVIDMQEDEAIELARQLIDSGVDPLEILDICREAEQRKLQTNSFGVARF